MAEAASGSPRWAPWATLPLSIAGGAVSAYLTWMHYTAPAGLSCPDTGVVNCTKVTTSAQSMVFAVTPVAVLGVAFFVAMTGLCLPMMWRSPQRWVSILRFAGAVAGAGMVCYLVGVELLAVHAICLWCTAVHGLAVALFVMVLAAHLHVPADDAEEEAQEQRRLPETSGVAAPDR